MDQLVFVYTKEGANKFHIFFVAFQLHAGQARRAASPQNPHHHGFRLIIGMMGERNRRSSVLGGDFMKKGIPLLPGRQLPSLSGFLHISRYVKNAEFERDFQALRQTADKFGLLIGFFPPKPVIDVSANQPQAEFRIAGQLLQYVQQNYGIGPPGYRYDDAVPR
ncbi:hypothetical protein D1872_228120 [compost metagenome]